MLKLSVNIIRLVSLFFFLSNISLAAVTFAGSSDRIYRQLNSSITADTTVAFWFKETAGSGHIFDLATAGGFGLEIRFEGTGVQLDDWGGVPNPTNSVATGLNDGNWHHAAVTREGTTYKLYVDGILDNSVVGSVQSYTRLFVGSRANGASGLNGSLEDFRVYNRALNATEIEILFRMKRKRIAGSLAQGLVVHYEMNDRIIGETAGQIADYSTNENYGWFVNFADPFNAFNLSIPTSLVSGKSLEFDGVNDYIALNSFKNNFSAASFSFWSYTHSTTHSGYPGIIHAYYSAANVHSGFLVHNVSDTHLGVVGRDLNGALLISDAAINVGNYKNQWAHFVVAFDGSVVRVYRDSVLKKVINYSNSGNVSTEGAWAIGNYQKFSRYFDGLLDDVRIYDKKLSNGEVAFLFNGSGLDPGTANLELLWNFDNDVSVQDASGFSNHGQGLGGAGMKYSFSGINR